MGGGHAHGPARAPTSPRRTRVLAAALLAPFVVATLVGLALLWPGQRSFALQGEYAGAAPVSRTVAGTVVSVLPGTCGPTADGTADGSGVAGGAPAYDCSKVTLRVDGGPDRGTTAEQDLSPGPGEPDLRAGDSVRLARSVDGVTGKPVYYVVDFARGRSLLLLGLLFAVAVVAVARWRGLAALLGLGVAFGALTLFVLPALLSAESPTAVALVGGSLIMTIVLPLAHGLSVRTVVALVGTLGGLALVGVLSLVAVAATHLTGLSNEENTAVQSYAGQVSITGLLLAGFVIGSLGVLNDITVTQASAVWELHAADPSAGRRVAFARAMRVGRDHIASSVYTLVLAYAGAALPVLLLFDVAGRGLRDVLTGDLVGSELVRSLVGGTGLVLAVPLTTALAAALVPTGLPGTGRPAS